MFGSKKPTASAETPENSAQPQPEGEAAVPPPEAEAAAAEAASQPVSREAELEAEIAKIKDQALRSLAEAENTRRRLEREMDDARKFAVSGFARELLAVSDNLRRAIEAVPADQREQPAIKAMLVGIEATERQLVAAFDKFGVKPVEAMGLPFDPNFHQVMFEVETGDHAPGTIVQVLQNGYKIADRLLRPALVGTAKSPASGQVDTNA